MQHESNSLQSRTRRHFFKDCRIGLGSMALASLLADRSSAAKSGGAHDNTSRPMQPKDSHFTPKAKQVIFLFMAGGPSQLELFDYKPKLQEFDGKVIPESYVKNKRFAFIKRDAKLLGTRRKFRQHGECGAELSDALPHLAKIVDDVAIVKSMKTEVFNHGPAKLFVNTGSPQFGRPAMGAWITYGIGSESDSLPGFVVLQSGPRGPRGGTPLWGSGFLPTTFQGVPFLNGADPVLNLSNPAGINRQQQGEFVDAVTDLNSLRLQHTNDPEIATRISAYEMAYRMQSSAPELMDLSGESKQTLDLYGVDPAKPSFARNCLLARRLVEKGTRFVQLYHTDWDHHGNPGTELGKSLDDRCRETDQSSAALVSDLKQRGLLEDTLVIWGGEFGRTNYSQGKLNGDNFGRDHHPRCFSLWMAGGGIKPGSVYGETDPFGYNIVKDGVHIHDFHATMMHLLGIDHERLTYRFQGRRYRLTDVHGNVKVGILA